VYKHNLRTLAAMAATSLAVAACGGGGGGDNDPPRIEGLADVTVMANETTDGLAFLVRDDRAPGNVQLQANSDNPGVLAAGGIEFAGTGSDRSVRLTPVPGQVGNATVTVTARDGAGAEATASFSVTVVDQDVSFSAFFRETFAADANAEPRDLNARTFAQDARAGEFDDLVSAP
jgi:hypothetical protein